MVLAYDAEQTQIEHVPYAAVQHGLHVRLGRARETHTAKFDRVAICRVEVLNGGLVDLSEEPECVCARAALDGPAAMRDQRIVSRASAQIVVFATPQFVVACPADGSVSDRVVEDGLARDIANIDPVVVRRADYDLDVDQNVALGVPALAKIIPMPKLTSMSTPSYRKPSPRGELL